MINATQHTFVIGTDTGVGKTVISLLLMQYFFQKNHAPIYLKPVQTGCNSIFDKNSDAAFIYSKTPQLSAKDPAESVFYCFKTPKAPWFSACDQGSLVDENLILRSIESKKKTGQPLIVEGAGGLMVPFSPDKLMIDLLAKTALQPVLVARTGLGTINHTLLSIEALKSRGIDPLGVIFCESSEKPTPPDMIHENITAVRQFGGMPYVGLIPKIKDFSSLNPNLMTIIDRMFASEEKK